MATTLSDLSGAIAKVADATSASVVGIGRHHRGSGVVAADGKVVTNAHNLRGDEVTVRFSDGRSAIGRVAGVDMDGDLAVVEVDTAGARPIAWSNGATPSLGAIVFAVAATAQGGPRVTFGTISAASRAFRGPGGRRIDGSLEHTAPLAQGSSGSPLVDADGKLVGLNTNRLGEGFYLALPADAALRERIDALGRGESPQRRRLGIVVAPGHLARRLRRSVGLPDRDGLLIRAVEDGSPAARAGIVEGDLLVEVAGTPVTDADSLVELLDSTDFPMDVRIVRGTEERVLSVGGTNATGEA